MCVCILIWFYFCIYSGISVLKLKKPLAHVLHKTMPTNTTYIIFFHYQESCLW